jgi:hypothetical protein
MDLSADEAIELEEQLLDAPGDRTARTILIAYYSFGVSDDSDSSAAHAAHVLWSIEHDPRSPVLGFPEGAELDRAYEDRAYEEGKALWLTQIHRHSRDPDVLWNAARYLDFQHQGLAMTLREQGRGLEPDNPRWSSELGFTLSLELRSACADRPALARSSLEAFEDALARTLDEDRHFALLSYVGEAAFEAREPASARWYARELLSMSERYAGSWNFGNAMHNGNTLLGRSALREGDVPGAAAYLRRAGATPGSPQLNSFGPDMQLAGDLLHRGQRAAVVAYLQDVRRFWEPETVDEWIDTIRAGGTPTLHDWDRARD